MSYILDALRKADAQRERDASRGIHAQTASLGATGAPAVSGNRMGCCAVAAVALVVAGAAAWFLTRGDSAPPAVVAPATSVPQAPPAAAAISPPPPVPAPIQAREAAFANRPAASAPAPEPVAGGLPPDAPRIAISGGVYSPNPAQRMLIVNGQVFNEGSEVAPGVKVEAIQARTAVLGFRGARYTVAY